MKSEIGITFTMDGRTVVVETED